MDSVKQLRALLLQLAHAQLPTPPAHHCWDVFTAHTASLKQLQDGLSSADIRLLRDSNGPNFVALIALLAARIVALASLKHLRAPCWPRHELLASVRTLTRLAPFMLELDQENPLWSAFESAIWSQRAQGDQNVYLSSMLAKQASGSGGVAATDPIDAAQPFEDLYNTANYKDTTLGHSLMKCLVQLLFTLGFTIGKADLNANDIRCNDVQPILWEPGISHSIYHSTTSLQLDSNRLEVLRLITVLCSNQLYCPLESSYDLGSRFLTILTTSMDRQLFTNFNASLINLICKSIKSDTMNGLTLDDPLHEKVRLAMVTYSIQLFSLMLTYPIPSAHKTWLNKVTNSEANYKNLTRFICLKISSQVELDLIVRNLLKSLLKSMYTDQSMFNSKQFNNWTLEILTILLELIQCNPKFNRTLASLSKGKVYPMLMFYILKCYKDDKHSNLVQLCCQFLLFLSSDDDHMICLLSALDLPSSSSAFSSFFSSSSASSSSNSLSSSSSSSASTVFFKLDQQQQLLQQQQQQLIMSIRDFLIIQISKFIQQDDYPYVIKQALINITFNLISLQTMIPDDTPMVTSSMRKLSLRESTATTSSSNSLVHMNVLASEELIQMVLFMAKHSQNLTINTETFDNHMNFLALILQSIIKSISHAMNNGDRSWYLIFTVSRHYILWQKIGHVVRNFTEKFMNERLTNEMNDDFIKQQQQQSQAQQQQIQQPLFGSGTIMGLPLSGRSTSSLPGTPISASSPVFGANDRDLTLPVLSRQSTLDSITEGRATPKTPSDSGNGTSAADCEAIVWPNDDFKIFEYQMAIGFSNESLGKKLVYDKWEDQWVGKPYLRSLLRISKLVNEKFKLSNHTQIQYSEMIKMISVLSRSDSISEILDSFEVLGFKLIKVQWNKNSIAWILSNLWSCVMFNYLIYKSNLLSDLGSSIKKVSGFWSGFSWSKMLQSQPPLQKQRSQTSSPILGQRSNSCLAPNSTSNSCSEQKQQRADIDESPLDGFAVEESYEDNLIPSSLFLGTNVKLFKVNGRLIRDHYYQIREPNLNSIGSGNGAVEGFWRRQSQSQLQSQSQSHRGSLDSQRGLRFSR